MVVSKRPREVEYPIPALGIIVAFALSLLGDLDIFPWILVPERFAAKISLEVRWKFEKDTLLEHVFSLLSEARFPNLKRLLISVGEGVTALPCIDAVLAQIHDFVKSRPQIVERAFGIPGQLFGLLDLGDEDEDLANSDNTFTESEEDELDLWRR
ncbi:uncharacterized protein FTOL_03820 [Fusarium torulosum]|uniref:Uncharacterized protein n=1 Tax=Fusarium torulosum TaxID=33205 RepID=A0AAE8M4P2_9HYPO|nr:uncharacterized protein FTOL_03820 [Fusarium torulosum]